MRARLFCRTGGLAGVDHQIGSEATIGRSAANSVSLGAPVISQNHARIFFDAAASAYILEDLQSRNGTRIDGIWVHGRERLGDLHVITLGEEHDFIFVVLAEAAAGPPLLTDAPAEKDEGAVSGDGKTVYEPPSALKLPALTDAPAEKDEGAVSGDGKTVYEPPSALKLPALTDAPAEKDEGAVSGDGKTVYEPLSALKLPALTDAPAEKDEGAVSGDGKTVYEPPSALKLPALTDAPAEKGEGVASGDRKTVSESLSALKLPALTADRQGPVDPEAPTVVQSVQVPVAARVVLEVTAIDGSRFRVELAEGRHYIGRARECAVWIDEGTLTRRHAVLMVAGDTVTIEDEGSLNGTFMDGVRLTDPVRLRVGDLVTIGDQVTVRLVDP